MAPADGSAAFTPIPASALPDALGAWRTAMDEAPGGTARYLDGALYLMVTAGRRNTGGYWVEIRSVALQEGRLIISARLHTPQPGQMVTQAITYPKAYARVDLTGSGEPPVVVRWE